MMKFKLYCTAWTAQEEVGGKFAPIAGIWGNIKTIEAATVGEAMTEAFNEWMDMVDGDAKHLRLRLYHPCGYILMHILDGVSLTPETDIENWEKAWAKGKPITA